MTTISFLGLGRLGLPVAILFASKGHTVHGYENDNTKFMSYMSGKSNLYEPDIDEQLQSVLNSESLILHNSYNDNLCNSEIIFIAVPTPSLDNDSFDTHYITDLLVDIKPYLENSKCLYPVIALISTVLPNTFENKFKSILDGLGKTYGFCYNAQFIAMGSVIENMLNPEFVLIGEYDERSGHKVEEFYDCIIPDLIPIVKTSIINAEIIKCVYNNFIGLKLIYANTIMEMSDKLNANCDEVVDVLCLSNKRLLSPKYLYGGLGDGGPCLVGSTLISLLDGTEITIAELVDREQFWVYSYDLENNSVAPGNAHSVRKTREKAPIYKIILDNGGSIRCTGDHLFLMRDGTYKEAKYLVPKDSLMPLYRYQFNKVVSIQLDGYEDVYNFEVDKYENYAVSAGVFLHNCHGRDSRALSYLSKQLNLSVDPFGFVSKSRVEQTDWLADKVLELSNQHNLPVKILGMTFKPDTNLIDDSPSLLLGNLLSTKGIQVWYYDPVVYHKSLGVETISMLYVIGTAWDSLREYPFVAGSIIVDPFGFFVDPIPNCEIVAIGRH